MKNVYKFVGWEVKPLDELKGTRPYEIMEKLNSGLKLTREEKDSLSIFEDNGYYRLLGWRFDFRPYCNLYLVKFKDYGWQEMYAFDKTQIRDHRYFTGIEKIIEIENKCSVYDKKQARV